MSLPGIETSLPDCPAQTVTYRPTDLGSHFVLQIGIWSGVEICFQDQLDFQALREKTKGWW